MRVNFVIPDELVKRLDKASKDLSISRSAFINMAISQKLQQDSIINDLPRLLKAYEELTNEEKEKKKNEK